MRMVLPGQEPRQAPRPRSVGPGQCRRIALIGGSPTLDLAPWMDPMTEMWVHASVALQVPRSDRLFDIHPKHVFTEPRKNGFADYFGYLKRVRVPIYMQQRYGDIPMSRTYPRSTVKALWPGIPLGSTTSYMIALALLEGVTHLSLWGIHYQHDSEYFEQRPNAELWVGIAVGLGVQVFIPTESPLCHEPALDYGYESHTPERYAARKAAFLKAKQAKQQKTAFDRSQLTPLTDANRAEMDAKIREVDPDWAAETAKFTEEERTIPADVLNVRFKTREEDPVCVDP